MRGVHGAKEARTGRTREECECRCGISIRIRGRLANTVSPSSMSQIRCIRVLLCHISLLHSALRAYPRLDRGWTESWRKYTVADSSTCLTIELGQTGNIGYGDRAGWRLLEKETTSEVPKVDSPHCSSSCVCTGSVGEDISLVQQLLEYALRAWGCIPLPSKSSLRFSVSFYHYPPNPLTGTPEEMQSQPRLKLFFICTSSVLDTLH